MRPFIHRSAVQGTSQPADTREFPRLVQAHYLITSSADATSLAKWDWVIPSGQDYTTGAGVNTWPSMRSTNPSIIITPIISGVEDNGSLNNVNPGRSPNQLIYNFTEDWWLKNADGTYPNMPGQTGRKMSNPTDYTPTNVDGVRWNQHLANWVKTWYMDSLNADGVLYDMTSDTSVYDTDWPNWDWTLKVSTTGDFDRNSVGDVAEHGVAWVNDVWGAALRDLMSRTRATLGDDALLFSNSGNGRGFAPWANGQSYEHGDSPANGVFPDQLINMFLDWEEDHFGVFYGRMDSQAGTANQTNYTFFRHNLAATLMTGAYFAHGAGAPSNYSTLWWYDEYSVDLVTGVATGDATKKGYLGLPTGPGQNAIGGFTGLWRRDFENGTAICNHSGASRTVSLGSAFRRISGTQAPTINSGATGVTSVTVPNNDGIILLR